MHNHVPFASYTDENSAAFYINGTSYKINGNTIRVSLIKNAVCKIKQPYYSVLHL